MKTGKFLFWLGIVVMVVELIANVSQFIRWQGSVGLNFGTYTSMTFNSFFFGGSLMGIGKILEKLYSK